MQQRQKILMQPPMTLKMRKQQKNRKRQRQQTLNKQCKCSIKVIILIFSKVLIYKQVRRTPLGHSCGVRFILR